MYFRSKQFFFLAKIHRKKTRFKTLTSENYVKIYVENFLHIYCDIQRKSMFHDVQVQVVHFNALKHATLLWIIKFTIRIKGYEQIVKTTFFLNDKTDFFLFLKRMLTFKHGFTLHFLMFHRKICWRSIRNSIRDFTRRWRQSPGTKVPEL